MAEPVRIQKFLSQAGVASRREAERLMLAGRVSVNGSTVTELGTRVTAGVDEVRLDGKEVSLNDTRWIVFNKPPGVLTTRSDPHGGRTVYDDLPADASALRYVGRLDRDAEGLLLLTNDGELANAVQHPSGGVEREYWVEVAGSVAHDTVRALRSGVELDDGPARPKRVELLGVGTISSRLTIVLTEGRKREVRRMMSTVGYPVLRLRRVRFGPVALGTLELGGWRELEKREVAALERIGARNR